MRAAAIIMLLAGDPGSSAARRRVIDVVRGAGLADYDDAAVDADVQSAGAGGELSAGERLSALSTQLAVPAREWFLAEMVRIGLSDGPLTDSERQAARDIGGSLGMTPAQAVGVIALTEEGASAG
jgi:hypothetical protein